PDRVSRSRRARLAGGDAPSARRRGVPRVARGPGREAPSAGADGDGGTASLRGRRRDALRQGRRDHGRPCAARRAHARAARRARHAADPGRREAAPRRLRVRQRRQPRGARRVRGAGRSDSDRVKRIAAVLALVAALGGGFLVLQATKPPWWEQLWYPLPYASIVRGHARHYRLDPALLAAVIYA